MEHHGVILRKLRILAKLPLKAAAKRIERSSGWLSEIENGKGAARIDAQEFERIIGVYDGEKHRKHFSLWIANACKAPSAKKETSFDGAILKFLRIKKAKMTLEQVSTIVGLSKSYLSYIESDLRPLPKELRIKLMGVYGYSPSSFKNFATEDKRANNIPAQFKLKILLKKLGPTQIDKLLTHALGVKI